MELKCYNRVMITILAEKPSQALEYAKAFSYRSNEDTSKGFIEVSDDNILNGEDCVITWGIGHLIELVEPEVYKEEYATYSMETLPIVPEKFIYQVSPSKRRQFNLVKQKLWDADTIVWAGDIDREGDYISYLICQEAGVLKTSKTFKRLWVNDLTKATVKKGFNNLKSIDDSMIRASAAQSRAIADWLIGINGSRLVAMILNSYRSKIPTDKYLGKVAVGRVMTAVQFLVYNREIEIVNFVPQDYFELEALFTYQDYVYRGKLIPPQNNKSNKWDGKLYKKEQWNIFKEKFEIVDQGNATVKEVISEVKYRRSPSLFSLGDLLVYIEKNYDIQPDKTKAIVQELYEKDKYTTYPRTPSNHVTKAQFDILENSLRDMAKILDQNVTYTHTEEYDSFFVSDKKAAVHAALTPTEKFPTIDEIELWSKNKQIIYMEILKRTFAMFMPKYSYHETVIFTEYGKGTLFRTSGNKPLEQGWKVLWSKLSSKKDGDEEELPPVTVGNVVNGKTDVVKKTTICPKPFTTGSLLEAMIHVDRLIKNPDDEKMKQMVAILRLAEGIGTEATRDNIIKKLLDNNLLSLEKKVVKTTPLAKYICRLLEKEKTFSDAITTAIWERALNRIESKENTQESFLHNIYIYLGSLPNPNGNGNLIANVNEKAKIDGDKIIEQLNVELSKEEEDSSLGICPKCGGSIIGFDKKKEKGKIRIFKCVNNKAIKTEDGYVHDKNACDFFLNGTILGKTISASQLNLLLAKGETNLIKGFKKKDKTVFNAKLYFGKEDNEYKISFKRFGEEQKKIIGNCLKCESGNLVPTGKSLQCDRKGSGCDFYLSVYGAEVEEDEWVKLLNHETVQVVTKKGKQSVALSQNKDTSKWEVVRVF